MNEISGDFVLRLRKVLRAHYAELVEFVSQPEFRNLLDEMYSLKAELRPDFVRLVVLDPAALLERGIDPSSNILIQRSSFGDRRPTLFCVRKMLPHPYSKYWQNVNLTFDNEHTVEDVPRDDRAWRAPLDFDLQADLIAGNRAIPET